MPSPTGHFDQTVQDGRPALLVNVPAAHAAHVRSADAVASVSVCWPAGHGLRTATHAPPLAAAEKVLPAAHDEHWRSVVPEPELIMPLPIGHFDHDAHNPFPSAVLNVPAAQGAHSRSLASVGALLMNSPAAHALRTGTHAAPPAAVLNVVPMVHAAHWRSAVAEPAAVMPWPAGHTVHGVHVAMPGEAANAPYAHGAQTKSAEGVAGNFVYCPARQRPRTATHAAPLAEGE